MLRMVNRLVEPDEGRILIDGVDIATLDPVLLRRNTGYMIQQIGLFPHLTVSENIGIIPKLGGMPPKVLRERVQQLLGLVQLSPEIFMDRYPRELSGGQQQRVGLARSLVMDPPLLLMDEPFGALDPVLRQQLQEEFLSIKKRLDKTILFVTHDVEEAFRLGDRVGVISGGALIQAGTPEDLIMHPASPAVADMIGAERRIRYLDHVSVGALMVPFDASLIIDGSLPLEEGRRAMTMARRDYILVGREGSIEGIACLRDLVSPGTEGGLISDHTQILPVFPVSAMASETLSDMNHRGVSVALISDGAGKVGILVMDEVVRRLL